MTSKGGYLGFDEATAPVNGIIPNVSGGSGYLGTSGWRFTSAYLNDLDISSAIATNSITAKSWITSNNGMECYGVFNGHGSCWLGSQYASSGDWMGWYTTNGGSRRGYIQNNGDFHIQNETGGIVHLGTDGSYACDVYLEKGSSSYINGFFYPSGSGGCCLGIQANRWLRYYGANASNISSDKRLKSDFKSFDKRYIDLFEGIEPTIYKIIANKNSNKEAGYIAQDIEIAMKECGITQAEFGVYEIGDDGMYSLIYQSLDMLLVYYVQEKSKEVKKQREEIDVLKKEVTELKELIKDLK